ncbi:MAG: hypothetical protein EA381_15060 [Planctomycetaceae bacterium]|nr:MAG: hypothetical protein EA381_15060 [Planctomycetaceae bacterium]
MKSLSYASLCLSALVLVSGCGGPSAEFPTVPVSITVTYKGSPLEGANISMVNNTTHSKPVVAIGRTDAQGVAKMSTPNSGDGAVKGIHLVTINKYSTTETAPAADIESDDYDPDSASNVAAPKSLIPVKYTSLNSGLTIEVGDTAVTKTFDLED